MTACFPIATRNQQTPLLVVKPPYPQTQKKTYKKIHDVCTPVLCEESPKSFRAQTQKSDQLKPNQVISESESHGLVLGLLDGTRGALEPRSVSREAAHARPENGVAALEEHRRVFQGTDFCARGGEGHGQGQGRNGGKWGHGQRVTGRVIDDCCPPINPDRFKQWHLKWGTFNV